MTADPIRVTGWPLLVSDNEGEPRRSTAYVDTMLSYWEIDEFEPGYWHTDAEGAVIVPDGWSKDEFNTAQGCERDYALGLVVRRPIPMRDVPWWTRDRSTSHQVRMRRVWRLLKRDGPRCGICGGQIHDLSDVHIDHRIPKSLGGCCGVRGGCDCFANLQLTHPSCNMAKGNRVDYDLRPQIIEHDDGSITVRLPRHELTERNS